MKALGIVAAALLGGVAVAAAGVATGVVDVPYRISLTPKSEPVAETIGTPAPADATTDTDSYDEATAAAAAAPAKAAPAPVKVVAAPPKPKPKPVVSAPARPRPTPVVNDAPSGTIDYFFNALAPYGYWVADPDYGYVFVPKRRGAGWRPYQQGQWVWTNDYGWYWESDEPFGWATYHYGRWDYNPDYGWFWVPGDEWAPAWVTFRVGRDAIGWAPIAPDSTGYAYGAPRRYEAPVAESWVFVDRSQFGAGDVGRYAAPIDEVGGYLGRARDVRQPQFEDGRYYNTPIGRPDRPGRELVFVDRQDGMFADERDGRIGVFRPNIDPAAGRPSDDPAICVAGRSRGRTGLGRAPPGSQSRRAAGSAPRPRSGFGQCAGRAGREAERGKGCPRGTAAPRFRQPAGRDRCRGEEGGGRARRRAAAHSGGTRGQRPTAAEARRRAAGRTAGQSPGRTRAPAG